VWYGKLVGGRVEGVDKMQVEDALPIDGKMLREEEWRRDGERKRYRDASLGVVAAGDELWGRHWGGKEVVRNWWGRHWDGEGKFVVDTL
jgi:hypothetical protein